MGETLRRRESHFGINREDKANQVSNSVKQRKIRMINMNESTGIFNQLSIN
jgi:hypothetical protein